MHEKLIFVVCGSRIFWGILIPQKIRRFGSVIPVRGYIIFITSNRNYSKKCRSLRWIGNSKGITFLEFYGGWGVSDALFTLYCTHRVAFFGYFTRLKKYFVHFLRHLFFWGRFLTWICQHFLDGTPFFWPPIFQLDFMRKNTDFFALSLYKCTKIPNFQVFGITTQNLCRYRF